MANGKDKLKEDSRVNWRNTTNEVRGANQRVAVAKFVEIVRFPPTLGRASS